MFVAAEMTVELMKSFVNPIDMSIYGMLPMPNVMITFGAPRTSLEARLAPLEKRAGGPAWPRAQ
jgi:hypothetical protein